MLQDFIAFIAKHLVERPEDVQVAAEKTDKEIKYTLIAASDDIGRIIGKDGRNIKALRTLVSSVSSRQGQRSSLSIQKDCDLDE